MNNNVLLSALFLLFALCLKAQTTAIPDANFEIYLETHTADGTAVSVGDANSMGDGIANNNLVLTNRINDVLLLDVSGSNISSLTGIQDFTALENLFCNDNNLNDLNVNTNTNLVSLLCGSNNLIDLDVSNLLNLEALNCADNQIQNLDISNNIALTSLTASGNQISIVDVSNNMDLTSLNVSNNRIVGELVVFNNSNLENLFCASNQISTLDVSALSFLRNLDASDNVLSQLDLSNMNSVVCPDPQTDPVTICQDSGSVNVSRNQLTSLIVANGYNDLFASLNATQNPDLFCIQIDNNFTVPTGWLKDDWTYYSEATCADIYTYVPDDNFEQTLIDLGHDDVLDNLVLTTNIDALTNLDVSNAFISSLIGIEDFIALENLDCSANAIENIDVSANLAIQQLNVANNNLSALDLNENLNITALDCSNNTIQNLDIANNSALTDVNCSNNSLTQLDLNANVLLSNLDCSFNQIETLSITANASLANVLCNDNNLFSLQINNGNNATITSFNATNNTNLFCIEVDDVAFANAAANWQKDAAATYNLSCGTYVPDDNFEQALINQGIDSDNTLNNFVPTVDINTLTILDVFNLNIADLTGIQDFVALQNLNCNANVLSSIDLSNNIALVSLNCSQNNIENLDVTTNAALSTLRCNDNALLNLNIKNGANATLTNFNATNNPNLFCINVDDAIVGNIPAAWQKDAFATYNSNCETNRFTLIPDVFFEQKLIDLGLDDTIDAQVLTSNIEHVSALDVSNASITDLTGIQDFKSLVELNCSGNYLNTLDVSNMLFLERLDCSSNYLVTNDINDTIGLFNTTGTPNLKELYCTGNNLNNLNTSQNTNLEILDCADNNLNVLNVNNNTNLRVLNCSNNNLENLDISTNLVLEDLNCNSNQIDNLTTIGANNTSLTNLSCINNDLSDLLIANYQGLLTLNCNSNQLTQLNIASNTDLEFLSASNNQIETLNLSNNTNLIEVLLSQNSLTDLNLMSNLILENLNGDFNALTQLDLNANTVLKYMSCSNNELSTLDLTANSNLIEVDMSSNLLTGLILPNDLGTLKTLNASNNQLEGELNLTTMALNACVFQVNQTEYCPETISINVSNNLFSFINLQNGINTDIANFNTVGNPNLDCIQVDDANTINPNWVKDEMTTYNENCNFGETFVPDDNFEQALIDLGYDTAPLNDYVLTATIETVTNLNVIGYGIEDLTGIEDFSALETLDCSNNALSDIDINANSNLMVLDCSNNMLTNVEVSNNLALTTLNCANNTISDLELSTNDNLEILDISNNAFVAFSTNDVLSLQDINCDANQISELDFQQNQMLTSISCESNALQILNIKNGQNSILANFNASNNPDLLCIETDTGSIPSGASWTFDGPTQLSVNCFFGQTFVPDDNFEQVLIDLGYDSGALDDYVVTASIENVAFLNLNGLNIADLTGIEDFVSLTNLNVANNAMSTIDLSNNLLLVNLNLSNNELTTVDVSLLFNLINLNLFNNQLTQINLDVNTNLEDVDVSSNNVVNLNVDTLQHLEDLNCASNQIANLNLTQNTSLKTLFCQSNALILDQLNIQNGNNENLLIFNATENPSLGCILVDDPVAVIENNDGNYDSWFKDDSASYQTICEDADNDGVPNEDDLCPNTPFGSVVDLSGCAFPNLPNDNFTVSITGETCLNSNNGKITIVAQDLYNYTVSLAGTIIFDGTGEVFNQAYNFTNDVDIFNLLADTYQMCITIEEWPDYESCYTVVITEPNPLNVFASRMASSNQLALELSGGNIYYIELNGDIFTTHNTSFTLNLQQGVNQLKVRTDLECQGVYEEQIVLNEAFVVSPNPFNNKINISRTANQDHLTIRMYSVFGQLVFQKKITNSNHTNQIDTSHLANGMYILKIEAETISTYKIIKE